MVRRKEWTDRERFCGGGFCEKWLVHRLGPSSSRQTPLYSNEMAHSGTKSIKSSWPVESQYTSAFSYDTGGELLANFIFLFGFTLNTSIQMDNGKYFG